MARAVPGVFVPRGVTVDADLRRRHPGLVRRAHPVRARLPHRFTNTYVTLPEGPLIIYWPEHPTFCLKAEPDLSPPVPTSSPSACPRTTRRGRPSGPGLLGSGPRLPMASVSTPLDLDGRHVATISHDVLLERADGPHHQDNLPGAYNVLFREDGQLIAHPELTPKVTNGNYNILGCHEAARGSSLRRPAPRSCGPTCATSSNG